MGGKRVCELCGVRESCRGGFFASFPLDENRFGTQCVPDEWQWVGHLLHENYQRLSHRIMNQTRCRTWVKIVGKEDLVYLPIEKLHKLRSICGDHFEKRDFNKKGNRLKKRAYPKLDLLAAPLPDELLREFPLHVASKTVHTNLKRKTVDNPIENVKRIKSELGNKSYHSIEEKDLNEREKLLLQKLQKAKATYKICEIRNEE